MIRYLMKNYSPRLHLKTKKQPYWIEEQEYTSVIAKKIYFLKVLKRKMTNGKKTAKNTQIWNLKALFYQI